jgi:hypothetical protein
MALLLSVGTCVDGFSRAREYLLKLKIKYLISLNCKSNSNMQGPSTHGTHYLRTGTCSSHCYHCNFLICVIFLETFNILYCLVHFVLGQDTGKETALCVEVARAGVAVCWEWEAHSGEPVLGCWWVGRVLLTTNAHGLLRAWRRPEPRNSGAATRSGAASTPLLSASAENPARQRVHCVAVADGARLLAAGDHTGSVILFRVRRCLPPIIINLVLIYYGIYFVSKNFNRCPCMGSCTLLIVVVVMRSR